MKYLYFSAKWCAPCRMLGPVMEKLGETFPVEKIDVDSEHEYLERYRIRSIPTVILVEEDGKELTRYLGAKPEEFFVREWTEWNAVSNK